jgi:hypothetical protein
MFSHLDPKSPVVNGLEAHEIIFARNQPEFRKLPAIVSKQKDGAVLTRWRLAPEDRAALAAGADVFVEVLTMGNALQPLRVAVGEDDPTELARIRQEYGLEPLK